MISTVVAIIVIVQIIQLIGDTSSRLVDHRARLDRPRSGHPASTIHPIQYAEEKENHHASSLFAAIGLAAVAT